MDMDKIKQVISPELRLISVLVFALAVRVYFLTKTWDQPLWWDATDYLNFAKLIGQNLHLEAYSPYPFRTHLLSIIWGIMFKFGANEGTLRITQLLISVMGVFLTYLLGKEMYGETTGIISASLMAVFWQHLFFTSEEREEIC